MFGVHNFNFKIVDELSWRKKIKIFLTYNLEVSKGINHSLNKKQEKNENKQKVLTYAHERTQIYHLNIRMLKKK